ncbi:mitochondrial dimethyladenosine transferase 1 [Aplysia californica]|uniref:rRNA adenine N(6)-methyltransferase n=1 Tax=Aplysia californica TaxID=6500 RepID=A0ABM0JPF0_APLCA|nr:mitochondrial dimethyladenosine transferase 1 [Aplysia californica]
MWSLELYGCINLSIVLQVPVMSLQNVARLPPLPTIQEIIRMFGLSARKKLSQNFLLDLNLTKKIVKSAGKIDGCFVIEVGPGPGGITRPILNSGAEKVLVVEKDKRFLPSLQLLSEASKNKLDVIHGDILNFNLESVIPAEHKVAWADNPPNVHIIGNLPFSVATPLIVQWLESISTQKNAWSCGRVPLTLTFQKEVAERIIAPPKSEYRCRLSAMCQYLCDVKLKFTIPGRAFVPPPKVDVGVVHFTPKVKPLISQPFQLVERVNRHLFHLPNKLCKQSLSTLFPPHREDLICDMFELSGIGQQVRPFQLTNKDIKRLCDAYARVTDKEPDLLDYDFRDRTEAHARRHRTQTVVSALEERLLKNS